MDGLFINYKIVLLDAAFFTEDFSETLRQGLLEARVWIPGTFKTEMMHYKAVLPPEKKQIYERNLAFLNQNKQLKSIDWDSLGDKTEHLQNDIFGMISLLTDMKASFILVTANQTLIHRVVLQNEKLDIFDLNENRFITNMSFPAYAKGIELNPFPDGPLTVSGDYEVSEGSILYRKGSANIVLEKALGKSDGESGKSGKEAQLFLLSGPNPVVVKVFFKGKLDAGKLYNIQNMQGLNKKLGASWALFPDELVYHDRACKVPAGFIEPFAATKMDVGELILYTGNFDDPKIDLSPRVSYSLDLCLKIVRQVLYLNTCGLITSDYNSLNFGLIGEGAEHVQMWDTDSFGYRAYFGEFYSGDATSRNYDTTTKNGAIGFCDESLYVFIFKLLTLGDAPINKKKKTFRFDNPKYVGLYKKKLIPADLWKLFEDVFRGKKAPSVPVLQQQLHRALQTYRGNDVLDKPYSELLKDVIASVNSQKEPAKSGVTASGTGTSSQTSGTAGTGSTYRSGGTGGVSKGTSGGTASRTSSSTASSTTTKTATTSKTSSNTASKTTGAYSTGKKQGGAGCVSALLWIGAVILILVIMSSL